MEGAHNTSTEPFSLLDLPWELVESVASHLNSRALIQLGMCSHEFKELASTDYYWRRIIQTEKKPILCVSAEVTDWKEIFRTAQEIETIQAANDKIVTATADKQLKFIFSPGTYVMDGYEGLLVSEGSHIHGLYDIPWAEKTSEQKTIFLSHSTSTIQTPPFSIKAREKDVAITLKNFSVHAGSKSGMPFGCILRSFSVQIENCEFQSEKYSALLFRDNSKVVVENCHFHDSGQNGVYCIDSDMTLRNCVMTHNMSGVEVRDCTQERQCIVDNCHIFENLSGVSTFDNQNNVLIKNCTVTKNAEFGVGCKHYSDITIIGNQIEKNGTGVVAFENTSVSLTDNVIARNQYWGLHIRYDVKVGQLTGNTITFNEAVGLQMPEQDNEHLSKEIVLKNNIITDNATNLVLDAQKLEYEFLYNEGDDETVIAKNVYLAVSRNICTFAATKANFIEQKWYECYTCGLCTSSGVCEVCVQTCHQGHFISPVPKTTLFYCDCGSGSKCKAMKKKL